MQIPIREELAIVTVLTEDLKQTIMDYQAGGWTVTEQNYSGEDLWELVLMR